MIRRRHITVPRATAALLTSAALSLGLVACGGDDGGGDAGKATDVVVGIFMDMLGEEGIAAGEAEDMIDRDCVADVVGGLSADDLKQLIDNGTQSELSDAGDAAMEGVIDCITPPE